MVLTMHFQIISHSAQKELLCKGNPSISDRCLLLLPLQYHWFVLTYIWLHSRCHYDWRLIVALVLINFTCPTVPLSGLWGLCHVFQCTSPEETHTAWTFHKDPLHKQASHELQPQTLLGGQQRSGSHITLLKISILPSDAQLCGSSLTKSGQY